MTNRCIPECSSQKQVREKPELWAQTQLTKRNHTEASPVSRQSPTFSESIHSQLCILKSVSWKRPEEKRTGVWISSHSTTASTTADLLYPSALFFILEKISPLGTLSFFRVAKQQTFSVYYQKISNVIFNTVGVTGYLITSGQWFQLN